MPNWCYNTVQSDNHDVIKYMTNINEKGEEFVDFNLLIPRPEELNEVKAGSWQNEAIVYYLSNRLHEEVTGYQVKKYINPTYRTKTKMVEYVEALVNLKKLVLRDDVDLDDLYEQGRLNVFCLDNYGYRDWYEWSCANWGTKWNACDSCVTLNDGLATFDTAWAPPEPVFEKLCKIFPEETIEFCAELEEGVGYRYENVNGKLVQIEEYVLEYEEEDDDEF